ncbi:MAG: YbfB/YjiJ family MFS transporter [Desulfarculaceae bacterium]
MAQGDRASTYRLITGGLCGLAVAMGIARFAYTPILPLMQSEFAFGDDLAGMLASANYAGYLLGALISARICSRPFRLQIFRMCLIASVATTAGMAMAHWEWAWFGLRFLSGAATAGVFVLGSAMVLGSLQAMGARGLAGWLFSGVGLGIALTGAAVPPLGESFGSQVAWLGMGVISLPLLLFCWLWLKDRHFSRPKASRFKGSFHWKGRPLLLWLTAAYFCAGLGYIVSGTFLVSIVEDFSSSASLANSAWVLTGAAAGVSAVIWSFIGQKIGLVPALAAAHLVQAGGILLPALSVSWIAALTGALLFGGTLTGIVALSMSLGNSLAPPGQGGMVMGLLTAAFGSGQILGPALAGHLAVATGDFGLPLIAASAIVALGGLMLYGAWRRFNHVQPNALAGQVNIRINHRSISSGRF